MERERERESNQRGQRGKEGDRGQTERETDERQWRDREETVARQRGDIEET